MILRAVVLVTCFALVHVGSAAAQGALRGTVTDAGTGIGLAIAQVSLPDLTMGINTGDDGSYEIANLPAGTHDVMFVLIGYQSERRSVTIADGQTTELDVALTEVALELEGLVVVGSRARPRTVTQSPVPVDVIPTREILEQGDADMRTCSGMSCRPTTLTFSRSVTRHRLSDPLTCATWLQTIRWSW